MPSNDELNWNDLRFFLQAARAGTLAGAAREMGVEHTTIGRRLSALERSVGKALVIRGPEGVSLTPLGAELLPSVEQVEQAVQAVLHVIAQRNMRVRLAVPSGVSRLFTVALPRLLADHPELLLELVSGARPVDLKKGEADLAIRSGPIKERDLIVRKLCLSGFSLYASETYLSRKTAAVDPNDLSEHDIVGYDERFAGTPPAKWIEERVAKTNIVLRSREMTDVLTAVMSGVGLAVLPCMLGDAESTLRRVTPEIVATHPLSLVYRREARLAPLVRVVIKFVIDVIKQNEAMIKGTRS